MNSIVIFNIALAVGEMTIERLHCCVVMIKFYSCDLNIWV